MMDRERGNVRRLVVLMMVLGALTLALALGPSFVNRVAYALESARSQAAREELAKLSGHDQLSKLFRAVAKATRPAVVEVRTTKKIKMTVPDFHGFDDMFEDFFRRYGRQPDGRIVPRQPPRRPQPQREFLTRGLGSGVIVDARKGYVLTNHHVVARADSVEVVLADKRVLKAEWIRSDKQTDLAVVKIKADKLVDAPLGDSERMDVGDWVLAIGAPEGLGQTVTAGIISAKGRVTGMRGYENYLQTDAAINKGNSGGPLVNMRGEVIGINTAIVSRTGVNEGIGLAVPSNMARGIMKQLIDTGKVVRGWLGVAIQNVDEKLARSFGVPHAKGALVTRVGKGSPAEAAGLKARDLIVAINDKETPDVNSLRHVVAALGPDSTAKLDVYRDGKKKTLKIKIGAQPTDMSAAITGKSSPKDDEKEKEDESGDRKSAEVESYGLTARPATERLAKVAGYDPPVKGLIITEVKPNSAAAKQGLRPGMIITHVAGKAVRTVKDFTEATSGKDAKEGVRVRAITPNGATVFVFLSADK